VSIYVLQVAIRAKFFIKLNDKIIFSHLFEPNNNSGEWKKVISTQWGFQSTYNKSYSIALPSNGTSLSFYVEEGDWLSFNEITIQNAHKKIVIPFSDGEYGIKPKPLKVDSSDNITLADGANAKLGSPLIEQWVAFSKNYNVPIMVGEMGVYNQTPHDVTLKYIKDMQQLLKRYHVGYAFWNFVGAFGFFDSNRSDVKYENYHGHQLDRQMLDSIQKYK